MELRDLEPVRLAQAVNTRETDPAVLRRRTAWIVVGLVALRLVIAAITPLAFDEAYYWTWSRSLAAGYYDHAPLVAWIIRAGTMLAGDTEFGVRLVSILLGLPMSYAVYRAAWLLLDDERAGADAAILLNATLMVAAGTLIVTPDSPLMVAASFVLLFAAKLIASNRGVWWLAIGAAVGLALLSKYTALFFGPAFLIWLLASRRQRHWLATPWPYLGALVALVIFAPVIWWNATHQWVSFLKQFDRVQVDDFTLRYIAEVVPAQLGLATPAVFALGVMGLYLSGTRRIGLNSARGLINATIWVIVAYFLWHSLHAHVEANWLSLVYPAFAVAAASATMHTGWSEGVGRFARRCRAWSVPVGVVLLVLLSIQVNTGWLTGNRRDGSVRAIGIGWPQLAAEIEALRVANGAACVLAANYPTTAWLAFYLPHGTCVFSIVERIRWPGEPDVSKLQDRLLTVTPSSGEPQMAAHPGYLASLGTLQRKRGDLVVENVRIDLIDGNKAGVLDRRPPPELVSR